MATTELGLNEHLQLPIKSCCFDAIKSVLQQQVVNIEKNGFRKQHVHVHNHKHYTDSVQING